MPHSRAIRRPVSHDATTMSRTSTTAPDLPLGEVPLPARSGKPSAKSMTEGVRNIRTVADRARPGAGNTGHAVSPRWHKAAPCDTRHRAADRGEGP